MLDRTLVPWGEVGRACRSRTSLVVLFTFSDTFTSSLPPMTDTVGDANTLARVDFKSVWIKNYHYSRFDGKFDQSAFQLCTFYLLVHRLF